MPACYNDPVSNKQKLDIGRVRIHEDAVVTATCAAGRLRPRSISLAGRALEVAAIQREWAGVHRGARLRYFLVTAGDGSRWKLCFQSAECAWLAEELPEVDSDQ